MEIASQITKQPVLVFTQDYLAPVNQLSGLQVSATDKKPAKLIYQTNSEKHRVHRPCCGVAHFEAISEQTELATHDSVPVVVA